VSSSVSDRCLVIVIGARSQIGHFLLPALRKVGYQVIALSRTAHGEDRDGVKWRSLNDLERTVVGLAPPQTPKPVSAAVIHLAPISVFPPLLERFAKLGVSRVVAFSSTSIFTKSKSPDRNELHLVEGLVAAERSIARISEQLGMQWTVFRPTLVYSWGHDRNVSEIGRFIQRIKFFPLVGEGRGQRQPVHAEDLANACIAALQNDATYGKAYNLAGRRTLSYRAMVEEIFAYLGAEPRFVSVPGWLIRGAIRVARAIPRFRSLSPELVTRMQQDMCFDCVDAERDFGFNPRPFSLVRGSE